MADFQFLLRLGYDADYVHQMQPQDIDKLGEEVSMAFQRCTVAESQVSEEDNEFNEMLLDIIGSIDFQLKQRAENSMKSRDGALLVLHRKTVITPTNLQALFRICDTRNPTGSVRCRVPALLCLFGHIDLTWKLEIPSATDGHGGESTTTPFALKQIATMAEILSHKGFCKNKKNARCGASCKVCRGFPWQILAEALKRSLSMATPPEEILDVVNSFDWPVITNEKEHEYDVRNGPFLLFYDTEVFLQLYDCAIRILAMDAGNQKATSFLQEQLGACHELLRSVLRRIISGQAISLPDDEVHKQKYSRLDAIDRSASFLCQFGKCFAPVPVDQETIALVNHARYELSNAFADSTVAENDVVINSPNEYRHLADKVELVLLFLDNWQCVHDMTDEDRCEVFQNINLSDDPLRVAARINRLKKNSRKHFKIAFKARTNVSDGEMCAACFVLESTLLDEGSNDEGLKKCSRCRQIKYCSRECQREHWKTHKKQCKKTAQSSSTS